MNNTSKQEPIISGSARAFFRGIEDQKRIGAESAKRHADTLNEHATRSKTMRSLLARDEFKGMSQAEISDLITQSMKAMATKLREK